MTAIQLHLKQHVGTTYKRALERFHLSRDGDIPEDITTYTPIERVDNWCIPAPHQGTIAMRKPRDYDAELESLDLKAKLLKQRKIGQLGELVIACGADGLPMDVLAGALLAAATSDASTKEVWRKAGAAMFQRRAKGNRIRTASPDAEPSQTPESGTLSNDRQPGPS